MGYAKNAMDSTISATIPPQIRSKLLYVNLAMHHVETFI